MSECTDHTTVGGTMLHGPAAPGRHPRPLRPFRHREYRLLIASGSASLLADGLWLVALVWQVIGSGGGPSDLSVVAAATSLGLVAAVLMGGVAADRFPKRAVLICVEAVRTAVPVATGVLALAGALQVWSLAVLAFLVGAAGGFYYPTWSAVVPALLPADELLAANGIEGMLRPLAQQAAGPAVAGLLVAGFSPQVALLGAGVAYLGALLPLTVHATRHTPRRRGPGGVRTVGAPPARRGLRLPVPHRVAVRHPGLRHPVRPGRHGPDRGAAAVRGPATSVGAGPAALSLVLAAYGVGSAAARCSCRRCACRAGT